MPLVYFHGIAPGWYAAVFPVYVVGDDPRSLTFTIQAGEPAMAQPGVATSEPDVARRRYVTRVMQQRIHQTRFRARVLLAYSLRCTICRLHDHPELLTNAPTLNYPLASRFPRDLAVLLLGTTGRRLVVIPCGALVRP